MEFHSAFVRLVKSKTQWIVVGTLAWRTSESSVPRLYIRGVSRCAAQSSLEKYRVDTRLLQPIEDVDEFLLLAGDALSVVGARLGPVKPHERCKPHGAVILLLHLYGLSRKERENGREE